MRLLQLLPDLHFPLLDERDRPNDQVCLDIFLAFPELHSSEALLP